MLKLNTKSDMASIFKFYFENGIIPYDDIMDSDKEELMSNIILKALHKYKISRGSDGRWSTYIPDPSKPNGRRLIRKKSQTELYKCLLEFYHIQEDGSRKSFADLYKEWIEYKRQFVSVNNRKKSLSPTTIKRYEREFDEYLSNLKLAKMFIGDITTPELTENIVEMINCKDMSEDCASNIIGYIKGAFQYAYDKEYIKKDPAAHLDRKLLLAMCRFTPAKADSDRVLTKDEIGRLRNAILNHKSDHPKYMPDYAIELALLTGFRVGELSTLKWEDIDEESGLIHIVRSEHRLDYSDRPSEIMIGLPKNGKVRVFPLVDEIMDLLDAVKALQMPSPEGFIFTREDGSRYTGHDIGCAAARRGNEAGIGKTSIHEIRRTVSSLLNTELPRRVVAEMLGHTERVNAEHYDYSTAETSEKMRAVEKVYSTVFNIFDYNPKTKNTGTA